MFTINQQDAFEKLCDKLKTESVIFIDTEFCRRYSYYPKLSIIQIGTKSEQFVIDAMVVKNLTTLASLMENQNICKVFHACDQDLEIFLHLFGTVPNNVFDTQIAAGVIGYSSSIGYGILCKNLLNINLDKSLQSANWLTRPLSQELLQYAVNDIKYLVPLYREITDVLDKRRLWDTYYSRSKHLYKTDNYKISPEKFIKRAGIIDAPENLKIAYTCMLLLREECAQSLNIPRNHCASDAALLMLATKLPINNQELSSLRLAHLPMAKKPFQGKLFETSLGLKESKI